MLINDATRSQVKYRFCSPGQSEVRGQQVSVGGQDDHSAAHQ